MAPARLYDSLMVQHFAGQLLVILEQGAVVAGAVAVVMEDLHHFQHALGQRDRGVHGLGGVHHVVQVLDVQVDAEAGLEVLVHHHGRFGVHDGAAGKAALDGLEDLFRFHAAHLAHLEGFRQGGDVHGHDGLVAQLGHVARTHVAAQHHGGPHLLKDGLVLVKELLVAAHHERQRAVDGLGLAAGLAKYGIEMLDAPVSGGQPKAIDGTLSFMVGGKEEVFNKFKPVLEAMGSSVVRCGDVGAGNVTKLCNQTIVAVNIAALAEAMQMGQMCGVEPEKIFEAIKGGLAGSTVMNAKAPMMMDQNFQPGFRIDLHIKDLNNVVDAAKAVDAPIPLTQQVLEMMKILHHDGDGSCDHSALLKYYQKLTGETLHH